MKRLRTTTRTSGRRRELAEAAARLMAEEGIADPRAALRKLLRKRHLTQGADLPDGREITGALGGRLALFRDEDHQQGVLELRRRAIGLMELCQPFNPRLVGMLLEATALPTSPIVLHLLQSSAEDVARHLIEHRIGYRSTEQRVEYSASVASRHPAFELSSDSGGARLVIFSVDDPRQCPMDPATGNRMARADLAQVRQLVRQRPASPGATPADIE